MLSSYILLPVFSVRLGLAVSPTLVLLMWVRLKRFKSLLVVLSLLLISVLISLIQYFSTPTTPPLDPFAESKAALEQLLQQQPTHRDVLVNLARIHQSIGNTEQAQEYLDRAKELDPNNPVFTQENKE